jgi:hypothetical protein
MMKQEFERKQNMMQQNMKRQKVKRQKVKKQKVKKQKVKKQKVMNQTAMNQKQRCNTYDMSCQRGFPARVGSMEKHTEKPSVLILPDILHPHQRLLDHWIDMRAVVNNAVHNRVR